MNKHRKHLIFKKFKISNPVYTIVRLKFPTLCHVEESEKIILDLPVYKDPLQNFMEIRKTSLVEVMIIVMSQYVCS